MEISLASLALILAAFAAGAAVAWLAARVRLARLETALEHERRTAVEKLRLLEEAQARLGDTFKALSSEALQGNNASFLHLARATLERFQEGARGDLERRQQAIGELVAPLRESLDKVDRKIQEMETARAAAYAGLTEHLRSLGAAQASLERETVKLVGALRAPAARGRWGEIQLQRVVEMAGMLAYCDFATQATVDTGDGRQRPDLVVRLPGGKSVVIDAKAPLDAYLDALEATDEERRREPGWWSMRGGCASISRSCRRRATGASSSPRPSSSSSSCPARPSSARPWSRIPVSSRPAWSSG